MKRKIIRILAITAVIVVLGLTGCLPTAFTPESAAVQSASDNHMPDFKIDPQSTQVTQTQPVGEKVIVQVKFSGVHSNTGGQNCLGVYEVEKDRFGSWWSGSSGVGCSGGLPPAEETPFSMGLTTFSGGRPGDPGLSIANGETYDDQIATIRVTWIDGTTQEAAVVNQTYMAVRPGNLQAASYDGLDKDGNIISSTDFGTAPGKQ